MYFHRSNVMAPTMKKFNYCIHSLIKPILFLRVILKSFKWDCKIRRKTILRFPQSILYHKTPTHLCIHLVTAVRPHGSSHMPIFSVSGTRCTLLCVSVCFCIRRFPQLDSFSLNTVEFQCHLFGGHFLESYKGLGAPPFLFSKHILGNFSMTFVRHSHCFQMSMVETDLNFRQGRKSGRFRSDQSEHRCVFCL